MTKIDFIEWFKNYNIKKERNKKLFIAGVLCFFALGWVSNDSHMSSILYIFCAVCCGRFLDCSGNSEESKMLKVAVKLLSQSDKNT